MAGRSSASPTAGPSSPPATRTCATVADAVKRGVWQSGGFPLEFPTMSLGETLMRPTAMLFRNLMAMEVEELLRANPLDGVVLLSGCDKTTPAMLMAAASADLPAIMVTGGPMLNGKFRGADVGFWHPGVAVRAGTRRGPDDPGGVRRRGERHGPVLRPLHDDGHGLDDGVPGRGAGHAASRVRGVAGRRFAPLRHGAVRGPAHRRSLSRRPAPVADHDAAGVRERDPRQRGDRRVHQRGHPPARHRRAAWRPAAPRRLRRACQAGADAGQPDALRALPDGGLLLRRRAHGGHAGTAGSSA